MESLPRKTVQESWKENAPCSAAFSGDRAKQWIDVAADPLSDPSAQAVQFAVQAATYAATCARLNGDAR